MNTIVTTALTVLGAATVPIVLWKLYQPLYIRLLHHSTLPKYIHGPGQPWAVVTGATGEIGFEFCTQLAAKGFHLIIHGRNATKLGDVQRRLAALHPSIQIDLLILDASATPAETTQALKSFDLSSRNLTVLVNNAGGASHVQPVVKSLADFTDAEVQSVMDLNVKLTTHLTHLLLPHLIRSGPSLILNISSLAATCIPYFTVYSSSKAYVEAFSTTLSYEMYAEGLPVDVECAKYGRVVNSNHADPFDAAWDVPTAKKVVQQTLGYLGSGESVIIPSFPQAVQAGLLDYMTTGMVKSAKAKIVKGLLAEYEKKS